jgi:DNA-binding Lrp family transcriptional regulator
MGYEMLHRGLITLAELNTLIEIADVAPWWRDKLIGISYSPYTRVDVRRLYVDGIITREDVKKNYLEIGYDEKHAENLTVWTCKGLTDTKKETVKDLSESKILLAYTDGEMSVDETTAALEALGYDADEADLLISLTDYTNYKSELTEEYNVLKAEWLAGITDETAAADTMSKLGLSQSEQAKWLRRLARAQRLQEIAAYVKESKAAMKKTEA